MLPLKPTTSIVLILSLLTSFAEETKKPDYKPVPEKYKAKTKPKNLNHAIQRLISPNADKHACVVNISSIQKCVRAIQNIENFKTGDPLTWQLIVGENQPLPAKPQCPSGGTYTLRKTFPADGTAALKCSCKGHSPASTVSW